MNSVHFVDLDHRDPRRVPLALHLHGVATGQEIDQESRVAARRGERERAHLRSQRGDLRAAPVIVGRKQGGFTRPIDFDHRIGQNRVRGEAELDERGTDPADEDGLGLAGGNDEAGRQHLIAGAGETAGRDVDELVRRARDDRDIGLTDRVLDVLICANNPPSDGGTITIRNGPGPSAYRPLRVWPVRLIFKSEQRASRLDGIRSEII